MRIAVIGPSRMPIAPPFGGGLEVFVQRMVEGLRCRGLDVDLFAAAGSQGHRRDLEFPGVDWSGHEHGARDDRYPPGARESETAAFARVCRYLERSDYDLVHNNSVHPSILELGPARRPPMVTTLHTPPQDDMQGVLGRVAGASERFCAVSRFTARQWSLPHAAEVIHNGVQTDQWRPGPGGGGAVWFGRLTREKAPHLAIEACRRLGMPLTLIGRCADPTYFSQRIAAHLGDQVRWLGAMAPEQIMDEVGRASLALATPQWDEPFGLVLIEALSCGTPVAAFSRGGIPEILRTVPEHLARPDDVDDLVRAARAALHQPRAEARAIAVERFDLKVMIDRYLSLFEEVIAS